MNETLGYVVTDSLYNPFSRTMSDDWNGDWFTGDLSNYASMLSNHSLEGGPQDASTPQASPGQVQQAYPARYQYQYGQMFGATAPNQLPIRRGGTIGASGYKANQQTTQHTSPPMHTSPRFPPPVSGGGARLPLNRSQSSTSTTSAFPTILPSQNLHNKPTPMSNPAYPLQQGKRGPPDAEIQEPIRSPKRRPSGIISVLPAQGSMDNSKNTVDLSEEERLLIQLKQDQNLPWKDIAKEFENRFGRPFQVPALQMRYKRLRERLRPWTNEDIAALEAAHEYWESNKFEIIANKMLDFGVQDRWPARYCERKWEQLHPETSKSDSATVTADRTKPQQPPIPRRFDTDLENHSVEWPMPSPPAHVEIVSSQVASPLSGLRLAPSTLPKNSFLLDGNLKQRPRHDPT